MDLKKSKRLILLLAVIYWVFAIGIYTLGYNQFRYSKGMSDAPGTTYVVGEIVDGMELSQTVKAPSNVLNAVEIFAGTFDRTNTGSLTLTLENSAGQIAGQKTVSLSEIKNNQYTCFAFDEEIALSKGETLVLRLTTEGCSAGNAITIYAGGVLQGENAPGAYALNGESTTGTLCVRLSGYSERAFYQIYWIAVVGAFLILAAYVVWCFRQARRGKSNMVVSLCTVYSRYTFLIKQLVSRDFKTKYKRSALGMAWSFVNPLLTMTVQYVVFSTLFKSDIPNYPVYLLTGIVFFSFFNEALTLGMTSITGNAALIKKVYMPKYIYPVSRVLSSLINFAFALMPLFLVVIFTGTPFQPAMLLLIFDIVCLLAFVTGMTLLLTTAMTFFQDTQFLWSVVSMMWQYVTPVFYPESIIPAKFLPIYRLNPMYQFITFARTCIIDGVSPGPSAYLRCILTAGIVLLLGVGVFRKQQNKFVLYV